MSGKPVGTQPAFPPHPGFAWRRAGFHLPHHCWNPLSPSAGRTVSDQRPRLLQAGMRDERHQPIAFEYWGLSLEGAGKPAGLLPREVPRLYVGSQVLPLGLWGMQRERGIVNLSKTNG